MTHFPNCCLLLRFKESNFERRYNFVEQKIKCQDKAETREMALCLYKKLGHSDLYNGTKVMYTL